MSTNEVKPQPCHCLRTKNPYGTTPQDAESWVAGIQTSSSYWCLHTMGPAGPDNNYVHLARCVPGRKCYQAQDEDE
jgi:hypothetical protein